jgi:hypothetical protein
MSRLVIAKLVTEKWQGLFDVVSTWMELIPRIASRNFVGEKKKP